MASSTPSAARASVRAMIRKFSLSWRAAAATLIFSTMSCVGTQRLPGVWPHFFGNSWSSSWMAVTPAAS